MSMFWTLARMSLLEILMQCAILHHSPDAQHKIVFALRAAQQLQPPDRKNIWRWLTAQVSLPPARRSRSIPGNAARQRKNGRQALT
jgi:hypothetical protein